MADARPLWVYLAPPAGFIFWIRSDRGTDPTVATLVGLGFLMAAVVVNLFCLALLAVCPFFMEPAVAIVNQALRMALVLFWMAACYQMILHHLGHPVPPWFRAVRSHALTQRVLQPFSTGK